jgi:hypothetical protein
MEYVPGEGWDDENCCYFEGTAEEREEFEFNQLKKMSIFEEEENQNDECILFYIIFLSYYFI